MPETGELKRPKASVSPEEAVLEALRAGYRERDALCRHMLEERGAAIRAILRRQAAPTAGWLPSRVWWRPLVNYLTL